jgi:acyl-coenzyme A synthetase/AMP-(fatty) acid ligase
MAVGRSGLAQGGLPGLPEQAAENHGAVPIWLDAPLDIDPDGGTLIDHSRFDRLVKEASGWLWAAGVRSGDRVAVIKSNNLDILALVYAAARIGAVAAPLNAQQEVETLATLVERLEDPVLVVDGQVGRAFDSAGIDKRRLAHRSIVVDGELDGAMSLDGLRNAPIPELIARDEHRPLVITHTSGTTGVPKLVIHTEHSVLTHVQVQIRLWRWLRIRETMAVCWSYSHVRALGGSAMVLTLGFPLVALTDPEAPAAIDLLERLRPGVVETYPNVLLYWEHLAAQPSGPFGNVKFFGSTFDAVHPRTVRTMLAASKRRRAAYVQGYGQSETGPATIKMYTRRFNVSAKNGRCVGWSMPGLTRVRVVDPETGTPLKAGQTGLIEVATEGRFITYVAETERANSGSFKQWWRTGDFGYVSPWRCLHMLDRVQDRIAGLSSTLHLEDVLLERLPSLTEIVLVSESSGRPVPVISTHDDSPLDVVSWTSATADLPPLARPVQIRWSEFPRTATWKVRRSALALSLPPRMPSESPAGLSR